MRKSSSYLLFVSVLAIVLLTASTSSAQTASALLREGDTVPGDSSGWLINWGPGSKYSAQNGVGGFAFQVDTVNAAETEGVNHIWGNTTGGTGTILRTAATFGDFEQQPESFREFGMSDAGSLGYRAKSNNTNSGASVWGTWVDSSPILNAEDPISTLPGYFSTYNSGVGITRDGTPYWTGRYSTTQGGSATGIAIFYGTDLTVLLKSGDSIGGITETVTASSTAIQNLNLRFSAAGTSYINRIRVDTGPDTSEYIMVSNGDAMLAGGSIIREGSSVPNSIGGLAGELYTGFSRFGITESGSYMINANTDAASTRDDIIIIDGEIILREGDEIDGLTLNGSIESAFLNEDGDWAAIWDVDSGADNLEALIFNGNILLLEGDLVDWNNDGVINGSDQSGFLTDFNSSTRGLTLSDRDANGDVRLLFYADVDLDGTVLQGAFSMSVSAVPEPSSMFVLVLMAGPMLARRRRIR